MPIRSFLLAFLILCVAVPSACAQKESEKEFDAKTYHPTYRMNFPKGWTVERFAIPIEFAPRIPYKGVEDLRFAPGWADTASMQHWSYCFLWWLEGDLRFNSSTLEQCLWQYYTGLVGRNIIKRSIPGDKLVRLSADVKKIKKDAGDDETFRAEVHMLDYLSLQPVDLHIRIHVIKCRNEKHTALFFEVSPRADEDPVWKNLHDIKDGFQCEQ